MPDHLQEFGGKSPRWLPSPDGLSRRPHGALPRMREPTEPAPSPLAKEACWQPCFSTRNPVSSSQHTFMHNTSHPFSWPMGTNSSRPLFAQMRKPRPTPEPGGFQRWGETLCPDEEGTGVAGQRAARARGWWLKCQVAVRPPGFEFQMFLVAPVTSGTLRIPVSSGY